MKRLCREPLVMLLLAGMLLRADCKSQVAASDRDDIRFSLRRDTGDKSS